MRLMVYPASNEISSFARYREMLKDIDSLSLVVPRGRGKEGEDFSQVDMGEFCSMPIQTNFHASLMTADTLYLPESPFQVSPSFLQKEIEDSVAKNKTIYAENLCLKELSGSSDLQLPSAAWRCPFTITKAMNPIACTIPVPVVFVMGLGPHTNKFEVQLALRKAFIQSGYRVSQIASKRMSWFFGFDSLPDDFWTCCSSAREKIIYLNRFLYDKYIEEKPDVMIIGVPGSIMPLNHLRFEEVCDMAFFYSQAVHPDLTVLCIYAHDYSQEYFNMLTTVCKYRYNVDVSQFVVAGSEAVLSFETSLSEFATVPESFVRDKLASFSSDSVKLYYALNSNDMTALGDDAIEKLIHNF